MGSAISYYQNNFAKGSKKYYTLTFVHQFEANDDQVYFTHCFPYTYSDLCEDLTAISKRPLTKSFFS